MRTQFLISFCYLLLSFSGIVSCNDKKEIFETEKVTDYLPLQVGKYITYRLDSTVFTASGTRKEVHHYQVKHAVENEMLDDAGNKTYLIQRTINNETASGAWMNNGAYYITPGEKTIDVIDNNLRVTVLQAPLRNDFNWNGNSRLPFNVYEQLFDFSIAGRETNKWNFRYEGMDRFSYGGREYPNVWTVAQHSDSLNIPPTSHSIIGYKEVSTEKYAKGIGMVFKDFQLYEYEVGNDSAIPQYKGFGITQWMIDHN